MASGFLVAVWLLFSRARLADAAEGRAVVVAVAPDATELDAAALRAAIAQELQVPVVSPDQPGAAEARGRLDVSIDRSERKLVVSFRGGAEPLERRIDLPHDPAGTRRAAVLLAGNLARDEADELAAQLRGRPAARLPAEATSPVEQKEQTEQTEQTELEADARLRDFLARAASHDRAVRLAGGATTLALGAATIGASVYAQSQGAEAGSFEASLTADGIALALVGAYWLALPSPFEAMSKACPRGIPEEGGLVRCPREALEQRWKRDADTARSRRLGIGIALLVVGAVDGTFVTWLVNQDTQASRAQKRLATVLDVTETLAVMGLGVFTLTTKSNLESRLREYESAAGRTMAPPTEIGVNLLPLPRGGMVGLNGRF